MVGYSAPLARHQMEIFPMISSERTLALLQEHLGSNDALQKHSLATGAIMKALAERFGEPPTDWESIGILHDLDFDLTRETPARHALETVGWLRAEEVPESYLQAITAHNEATGAVRQNRLEHSLAAAESITGLVVACSLVLPDKKISSVKTSSIKKRMKEKAFARRVSRESILECEQIGIPIDEFITLSLAAMVGIEATLTSH